MTHWQIALGVGGIALLIFLWSAQKSRHPFDIRDVLMDPATGKASLNALIIAVFALLSCWVVVDRELQLTTDVPTVLLGVLGVFVTGRAVAQGINAFKPSPDVGVTTRELVTRDTTTTLPLATEAPEPVASAITAKPKK